MSKRKSQPPVVMAIGGMDPSGGAGLCADIQTLSAMGCHTAPVVTAITVQDTTGVKNFQLVESNQVRSQMEAVLNDMTVSVVKTGMLGNRGIVSVVFDVLSQWPGIQLVIDPVLSSNSDERLSEHSLIGSIIQQLMPIASLICPNVPEAAILAGKKYLDNDVDECAQALNTPDNECDCLITGTHANSNQVINRYYRKGSKVRDWAWQRLQFEYHGSGCTLASAIAAGLAHGMEMEQAMDQAQQFVFNSLLAGFKPGHGQHIPYRISADPVISRDV
ncbi:hydroxymethylpyrimidine/phosphomethylpyrimidine kinase [Gammaproteobacteria bacterium]|nr:hydroxymethylpyrimidine/phosphomethylpyrimidine kinase [Gammaproteobacteria bacterium]